MNLRQRLQGRIARKEKEIQGLEARIKEEKAYIQGIQDMMKMLPRDSRAAGAVMTMRPGTQVGKAYNALREHGKPMHIHDVLKHIGKEVTKGNRSSMAGSLGAYVRRGEIFTRPKPATFGLVEWAEEGPEVDESAEDVPDDFGVIDTEEEGGEEEEDY